MEKIKRVYDLLTKCFAGLAVFGLFGTITSKALALDPGFIAPLTTVLLILCGASVVALGIRDFISVAVLMVLCGGAEIVGVLTGLPFGHYEYTDRWWPTLQISQGHLFPVLVPFAWLLVLGGAYLVVRTRVSKWVAVPISAALTTLIDMPMERAMTDVFHYWKWQESGPLFGVPVTNSLGWFAVSLVAAGILAWRDNSVSIQSPWKVPTMFCIFVASCGAIAGADPAWVMLLSLGLAMVLISKPNPSP